MEFKEGASIYTLDREKAGNLQRVVIDPQTKHVTHIVIQKGFLFKEDKVVPLTKVDSASQDMIAINCSLEELKELSPLHITQYRPKDKIEDYDHATGGMYTSPPAASMVISETIRTIPEDLVALKEGAPVMSLDERHVGNVERIFTDEGMVTHFTLSQGLLSKTEKSIPFDWVTQIHDNEVDLSVDAQKIESLPPVQGSDLMSS